MILTAAAVAETLKMGTNAAFPPYEYMEGDDYAGIDIEIAQAIADKLGRTLEINDVEFGSIIGENVHTGIHTAIYPGRKIWADVQTRPGDVVQLDLMK